jgi:signal transduction histidine kinase
VTKSKSLPPDALALLGHELRTPLNAVIGFADAMRTETFGPLPAPYAEHARIIHEAGRRLLAIVDEMVAVADAEGSGWAHRPDRFDPRRLAEDTVALLVPRARSATIQLVVNAEASPAEVVADRRSLGQILVNLIDNALKFTAPGGFVSVTLSRTGDALTLAVADSGAGTPPPDPPARPGLGLRLVRALTARHGGSVRMERNNAGGVTVAVELPLGLEA